MKQEKADRLKNSFSFLCIAHFCFCEFYFMRITTVNSFFLNNANIQRWSYSGSRRFISRILNKHRDNISLGVKK